MKFLRPPEVPKVSIFGPNLTPIYPVEIAEIEKKLNIPMEKIYPSGYSNQAKLHLVIHL